MHRMKQARIAILIAAIVCCSAAVFFALYAGGTGPTPRVGSAARTELILYCAAGVRPAAQALIEAFEANRNVKIRATYAGAGHLLGQIASVEAGDLFMPGAELYVDTAIEKGLALSETKRIVAFFVPVIFVRKGNPHNIASLQDLTRKGLRLGFGDERSCAVGDKTLKILEKNRILYEAVEDNVVYKSGTVNELGVAIKLGNVDAVILWDATGRNFARYGEAVRIPDECNVLSPIPIVVLKSSKHPRIARKFTTFVASEQGRGILADNGYNSPAPQPDAAVEQ